MKKIVSLVLVVILLGIGLFTLTGCDDSKTLDVSAIIGKGKITFTVSKNEEGEAKYKLTETKPEGVNAKGKAYLETEKAVIAIDISTMVYNTATRYQDKYGKVDATFDGYLAWIDDKDTTVRLSGMEKLDINGRKAIRSYNRTGGSGQYTYDGYFYNVGVDDIYPGQKLEIGVFYKGTEKPTEAKELDEETLAIINSLKVTLNSEKN